MNNDPNINKKIGLLTIVQKTNLSDRGYPIYKCICECGRTCYLSTVALFQNNHKTCGCHMSYGEAKIARLLTQLGYPFERRVTQKGCVNETGYSLRFDFLVNVDSKSVLLEFRSKAHEKVLPHPMGAKTASEKFARIQKSDTIKEKWAARSNTPYVVVWEHSLNTLTTQKMRALLQSAEPPRFF